MALERFIPKSPDPFIRNSQDFEVAKFGHLNTIIEYINSYVVTDSLQLAGSGPITSTARYISDSTGVNSAISISTIGVGIGTDAPITPLNVYNSSSSVSSVILVEQDTSATIGQINQYRKNGSVNLTSGTEIGRLSFGGYFNSTYSPFSQVCSAVIGYYGGTGTDRTGGLRLTTWNGGGATTRLQVAPDGKISIGTTGSNAKLQIVGEGSTSATTSLLVQNSAGTAALTVRDDLYVFGGSRVYSTGNMYMDGNTGTLFSAWGQLQLQGASYVQIMNDTLRAGSQNFNFLNTSFSPNNNTNSNLILSGNGSSFTNIGAGSTSVGNVLSIPIGISTSTGNVTLNHINIGGVVNTTAGTTLQRGFYYNPTLTGTVGFTHRAIETVTGDVLLGTTSGRVGIGTSTPSAPLEVRGLTNNSVALRIGGLNTGRDFTFNPYYATNTYGGLFSNESGNITLGASLGTDNGSGIGIILGAPSGTRTALLQVKGTGSTSATTSLLVQNSSGSTAFQVKDNLQVSVGDGFTGDGIRFEAGNNSSIVFTQGADRIFLTRTNGDQLNISFISGTNTLITSGGICNDGSGINIWKFEGNVNTAVTMDNTKYLKVFVGGVAYKLAVCV
jgi:hypothetical protein